MLLVLVRKPRRARDIVSYLTLSYLTLSHLLRHIVSRITQGPVTYKGCHLVSKTEEQLSSHGITKKSFHRTYYPVISTRTRLDANASSRPVTGMSEVGDRSRSQKMKGPYFWFGRYANRKFPPPMGDLCATVLHSIEVIARKFFNRCTVPKWRADRVCEC